MGTLGDTVSKLRLALQTRGYSPIPALGKKVLLEGWQTKTNLPADEVAAWAARFPGWINTGILTHDTPVIDIDITHAEAAAAVEELARDWWDGRGTLLVRIGNAPKRAMLFRTGSPFSKITCKFIAPDGGIHKIEILGRGQQVIVDGVHPDTRKPYTWHGGYEPWDIAHDDLPEITEDEAHAFLKLTGEALVEQFGFQPAHTNGADPEAGEGANPSAPRRVDVEAELAAMDPADGEAVNQMYMRVVPSLLRRGIHPDDVLAQCVDAAMAAAAKSGQEWNRAGEIKRVSSSILSGYRLFLKDYDPATGEVPAWMPIEFHDAWAEALAANRSPQISRNHYGFHVWTYGARDGGAEAKGSRGARTGSAGKAAQEDPAAGEGPPKSRVILTPFKAFDLTTLPPREWLLGKYYQRGIVSATIGPGGHGKTSLNLTEAIAMATGRDLLGDMPSVRCHVWVHNGDDTMVEMKRRVGAICQHYQISMAELEGWLFITTRAELNLRVANGYGDLKIDNRLMRDVVQAIAEWEIDVAMFDPLVTLHNVPEGDNNKMDVVVRLFAQVAGECDCSTDLVHHARKQPAGQAPIDFVSDDGRGASAIRDAVRASRVLNVMSAIEAQKVNLNEFECRSYFRVDRGKGNNTAPARSATWRRFVGVVLPNGDDVGVVTRWTHPGIVDGLSDEDCAWVQSRVRTGDYREDTRALGAWVGTLVAERLGLDLGKAEDKAAVRDRVDELKRRCVIRVAYEQVKGKNRPMVRPGEWRPGK